jgi:hypothetical protein
MERVGALCANSKYWLARGGDEANRALLLLHLVWLEPRKGEDVPQLPFSTSIPAGGVVNVITGWQYEYLPWPARIKLLMRAPVATLKATVFSGSETIQEEGPVQSGGVAGTTPAELTTPPVVWDAPAGDRLKVNIRSTDAGAQTIDGIIYAYPLG